ncbi:YgaB-like protein [Bacillus oleivorans]|uniref:YgaB-like protein n=1 Tax=Bacillus oleivorans TaxID=1448271 RepID=A0A285CRU8_9BACI|nr:YgaB family protein [Bacillus oleivorans]SNX70309.1 YgaB-like protein [Bacillus oleivorans]
MGMFEKLVQEQMKTMEQLLFLQSELERCQNIEAELIRLQEEAGLQSIQHDIENMRIELKKIQQTFEEQTKEVILTYQLEGQKQVSV